MLAAAIMSQVERELDCLRRWGLENHTDEEISRILQHYARYVNDNFDRLFAPTGTIATMALALERVECTELMDARLAYGIESLPLLPSSVCSSPIAVAGTACMPESVPIAPF